MTLEEIKHDLFSFTDKEVISWLIAEVEKYQKLVAGNSQLQIDWIDVTATRCIEIAGEYEHPDAINYIIADAIRREFKAEE